MKRKIHLVCIFLVLGIVLSWIILTPGQSQATSSWEEVHHEGDLIIDQGRTFVIEDKTYHQTGNIYVRDNAKLIVRDATLVMHMGFDHQYRIYAEGSAKIEMENASVESSHETGILGSGRSQLSLRNASLELGLVFCGDNSQPTMNKSTVLEFKLDGSCIAAVEDSTVKWAVSLMFGGTSEVELSGLTPGLYESWDLYENAKAVDVPYELSLRETYVGAWSIDVWDAAKVVVRNSDLTRLVFALSSARGVISGIRPGSYDYWDLHEEQNLENAPLQLTLIDTSVSGHWIVYVRGTCDLAIRDSITNMHISGVSNVVIADSILAGRFTAEEYWGTLTFEATKVRGSMYIRDSIFRVKGSLSFFSDARIPQWNSARITRTYDIVVQDREGTPLSDVSLQIEAPDGQLSAIGKTDAEGKASFVLTFNNNNYQKTWALKAPDLGVERDVRLLTDTPIVVTAP